MNTKPLCSRGYWTFLLILPLALAILFSGGCATGKNRLTVVPKWERFEGQWISSRPYTNAPQEATLTATFTSPLGEQFKVYGFWDGGNLWRVRFQPNQAGNWTYVTACTDASNQGLHQRSGSFICTAPLRQNRFSLHGRVGISRDGRYLQHEDGTPFFWLGDTAWNGPLKSTDADWNDYLATRQQQGFTAVQWVTTQWRAAPDGDLKDRPAYTGQERIQLNPEFFQRLDQKADALNRAGLLSVPVMLWAINGGSNPQINPGVSLPEDQAILLARYQLARWGAHQVVWILNGDGDYRGQLAEKWKRIGRAVFAGVDHAPVTVHPGGRMWVLNEFLNEPWLGICGYQSAHNERPDNSQWICTGPPAQDWKKSPVRPFISLEAPYEAHMGGDKKLMSADVVRRAHYWSLLNAPTAGLTYGGHGIWGWDDGTKPPVDHPTTGTPQHWRQALQLPGAGQMTRLAKFFTSLDFWRLRPAPELVVNQPGITDPQRFLAVARTEAKDLVVAYVPADRLVELKIEALMEMPKSPGISWINPRTGEKRAAVAVLADRTFQMPTPDAGDWLLVIQAGE